MKELNKMTPEELRELVKQKEEQAEQEKIEDALRYVTTISESVYYFDPSNLYRNDYSSGYYTKEVLMKHLTSKLGVAIPKGTKVYGYEYTKGEVEWWDDGGYGIEEWSTKEVQQLCKDEIRELTAAEKKAYFAKNK